MRKIKILFLALIICSLPLLVSFAQSVDNSSVYIEEYEKSGADDLKNHLPKETKDYLSKAGIDDVDFDSVFSFSLEKMIKLFCDIASGNIKAPLKSLCKIIGILFLIAAVKALVPSESKVGANINIVAGTVVVLSVFVPILDVISRGVTAVEMSCAFMKALIPVLTLILAMGGNPALSLSYNGLTLAMAEGAAHMAKNIVLPLSGIFTSVAAASSISSELDLKAVTELMKKTAITTLSVIAALFSAVLSLKGIMAGSADSLVSRGIKLFVSSGVPIVGGALSEAYSSVIGSINLLKSTVGIFGIIAVAVINLPVITELVCWILCFKISSAIAQLLGETKSGEILEIIASSLTVINVTVIFTAVLFIVSSAIILSLRTLI